jgi:hypothetical protein
MGRYKLEVESDGNLGIYCSQPETWIGSILEPESPNPVLALGTPLGILGVRRILDLLKKWKVRHRSQSGKRQPEQPSRRALKCRSPTRKWRKALKDRL